jgi:hypothetical protein
MARCQWLLPVILATQEAEIRSSRPAPGKYFMKPYLKTTSHKRRADGVAQVMEHLPSKYKVLSLNQSTAKKKKS